MKYIIQSHLGMCLVVFVYSATRLENQTKSEADQQRYFISYNLTSWSQAESDCKAIDNTAGLVDIETESELYDVLAFSSLIGSYWTGGRWNLSKQAYEWSNGVVFGRWVEWMPGGPKAGPPVALWVVGGKGYFEIRDQDQPTRSICERNLTLSE